MYRAIVADDDCEFRDWFRSILNDSDDFQLIGEACNGTEALYLAALLMPDLMIADVYMPEPDGLAVAQHIRRHFSNIKIILTSAHEASIYESLAHDEGALTFIPKQGLSLRALRQVLQEEVSL